jgi:hypothetical protein
MMTLNGYLPYTRDYIRIENAQNWKKNKQIVMHFGWTYIFVKSTLCLKKCFIIILFCVCFSSFQKHIIALNHLWRLGQLVQSTD